MPSPPGDGRSVPPLAAPVRLLLLEPVGRGPAPAARALLPRCSTAKESEAEGGWRSLGSVAGRSCGGLGALALATSRLGRKRRGNVARGACGWAAVDVDPVAAAELARPRAGRSPTGRSVRPAGMAAGEVGVSAGAGGAGGTSGGRGAATEGAARKQLLASATVAAAAGSS